LSLSAMEVVVSVVIVQLVSSLSAYCLVSSLSAYRPWQGQRASNPQPSVLETDALPIELCPYGYD
jgi:hypothetical protein